MGLRIRTAAGLAGQSHETGEGLHHDIVRLHRRERPFRPEARDAAVDDAGVHRAQRVVVDSESGGNAGRVVLHHDISVASQRKDDRPALLRSFRSSAMSDLLRLNELKIALSPAGTAASPAFRRRVQAVRP